MKYEHKNFDHLFSLSGFSDNLLKKHFALYQGYVNNTNKITEIIAEMIKNGKTGTPEFAELKRRLGWEFNGMRLHELYFENLTKTGSKINKDSMIFRKIIEAFGSYEAWETDFKSTGTMRGIGWVILYYDHASGHLFNAWVNEHDTGHLAGAIPLLVMDVFEHAYITDYGLKKADYIAAFFAAVDWTVVEKRLEQ